MLALGGGAVAAPTRVGCRRHAARCPRAVVTPPGGDGGAEAEVDGEGATGRRRAPASLADGGTPAGFGGALAQSSLVSRIFGDRPSTDGEINFAQMMEYLVNKRVLRLLIYDSGKTAIVEVCIPGYEDEPAEKMEKQRFTVLLPGDCQEEVLRLAKLADRRSAPPQSGNVACRLTYVDPASQYPPLVGQAASWLLPIVAFAAFTRVLDLYATLRGKKRNLRQEMASQLGKSRAARTSGLGRGNTGVLFADVAGQEPAIQAFQELISMILGNPRFKVAGAKLPRGVLLEGPPGTGKTLLARAVAGEAGVPFFSANGSEFVEMYVGVAAARVRDLFRRARAAAPSIIFIDEIDAIGRARTGSSDPGSKEREQGLLQLLVEVDGFASGPANVLLIGATNRREVLDQALLRSGRFDRVIRMDLPTLEGRLAVLAVHAAGKIIPQGLDSVTEEFPEGNALLRKTAQLTVGYSGAELANLMNEAAILAVRRNLPAVTLKEIDTAMEKLTVGLPRPPLPDSSFKRQLATVFASRAVLQALHPGLVRDVLFVSIAPRGSSTARLESMPSPRSWVRPGGDAGFSWSESVLRIALALGGRAAEEEFHGASSASLVTADDVGAATRAAVHLVGASGLFRSRRGAPAFRACPVVEGEAPLWPGPVRVELDEAVVGVVEEAHARARHLVRTHRSAITATADALCSSETLYGEDIAKLIAGHPPAAVDSLPVLAAEPRDWLDPPHAPGCASFRLLGECGVATFARRACTQLLVHAELVAAEAEVVEEEEAEVAAEAEEEAAAQAPSLGLVGFCFAPGAGRIGLAQFSGWAVAESDEEEWEEATPESSAHADPRQQEQREGGDADAAAAREAAAVVESEQIARNAAHALQEAAVANRQQAEGLRAGR